MPRHNRSTPTTATRVQRSKFARTASVAVDLGITTPDGYGTAYGAHTASYGVTGADGYPVTTASAPRVPVYGPSGSRVDVRTGGTSYGPVRGA